MDEPSTRTVEQFRDADLRRFAVRGESMGRMPHVVIEALGQDGVVLRPYAPMVLDADQARRLAALILAALAEQED